MMLMSIDKQPIERLYMNTFDETLRKRNKASAQKGVLNEVQVLRIKEALALDVRAQELASLYGVSYQTIVRIRDRKTWGWLQTEADVVKTASLMATPESDAILQERARVLMEQLQAGGAEEKPEVTAIDFYLNTPRKVIERPEEVTPVPTRTGGNKFMPDGQLRIEGQVWKPRIHFLENNPQWLEQHPEWKYLLEKKMPPSIMDGGEGDMESGSLEDAQSYLNELLEKGE